MRLACVSHAASVRSEPGSNSSIDDFYRPRGRSKSTVKLILDLPGSLGVPGKSVRFAKPDGLKLKILKSIKEGLFLIGSASRGF